MKIRVLPSITDQRSQLLISFLINDCVSVDAGAVAFHLTGEKLLRVKDLVLTHVHLDHIASFPFIFSEEFTEIQEPVRIHASERDIHSLKAHIFNNVIWPDFTKIPNQHGQLLAFHPYTTNQPFEVAGLTITPIPVNHTVETFGLVVDDGRVAVAFSSDTARTDGFWEYLNTVDRLKAVFVDVAFNNALESVALASKHLTPHLLVGELEKLTRPAEIFAVNLKPMCRTLVAKEVNELNVPDLRVAQLDVDYEW